MNACVLPLPDSFATATRLPRSGERRLRLAVAVSILFHCAWLGGVPALTGRDAPAQAPLQVHLARHAPPAPEMPAPGIPSPLPSAPPQFRSRTEPPRAPRLTAFAPPSATDPAVSAAPVRARDAPLAGTDAAPHAGPVAPAAADEGEVLNAYGRQLAQTIARQQRYPRLAQVRQWQGTAVLQLHLTADGALAEVRMLSSSGHEILDRQAIDMVREAVPLPRLPATFADRPLTIDVPVVFRLAG